MFTFLHAADIHLDSPLLKLEHYEGAPVQALRGATRRALGNLVRTAIDESVDFVMIAGDLYDGKWRDFNTGLYFVSQMSELRKADIPVYIISGNHDAESNIAKAIQLPENVHIFSDDQPGTVCLDTVGAAIHGQGFSKRVVRKDLSAGYPTAIPDYFNIGMLHTCATGREGHGPYAPCTVNDLQSKGYDYWALGHVHQREILSSDPPIVFPGNIQGRHIREHGPKGCTLVRVNGNGQGPDIRFHPLDVIRWVRCDVDVSDVEERDDVVKKVRDQLESLSQENEDLPLAARIEITGASPVHAELSARPDQWMNDIRSTAIDSLGSDIWIEKIRLRTWLPQANDPGEGQTGPVREIFSLLDEVQSDPEKLKVFDDSLDKLRKKLRRELRDISETVFPDDPEWLAHRLDEVRAMLIREMAGKGEAS